MRMFWFMVMGIAGAKAGWTSGESDVLGGWPGTPRVDTLALVAMGLPNTCDVVVLFVGESCFGCFRVPKSLVFV